MARKKKKDSLGVAGLISAIARGALAQRSMAKARKEPDAQRPPGEKPVREKKAKDTRTPEQIRAEVDATRTRLVGTVETVKYKLDVPARAEDVRARLAAKAPAELKGEPQASFVAGGVLAVGLGIIATGIAAAFRRR